MVLKYKETSPSERATLAKGVGVSVGELNRYVYEPYIEERTTSEELPTDEFLKQLLMK